MSAAVGRPSLHSQSWAAELLHYSNIISKFSMVTGAEIWQQLKNDRGFNRTKHCLIYYNSVKPVLRAQTEESRKGFCSLSSWQNKVPLSLTPTLPDSVTVWPTAFLFPSYLNHFPSFNHTVSAWILSLLLCNCFPVVLSLTSTVFCLAFLNSVSVQSVASSSSYPVIMNHHPERKTTGPCTGAKHAVTAFIVNINLVHKFEIGVD